MEDNENLDRSKDTQEETADQEKTSEELREIAQNFNGKGKDEKKTMNRRKFLGKLIKGGAGIAIGSTVLGKGIESLGQDLAENNSETKEDEKGGEQAMKLIGNLYNLPGDQKLSEAQNRLNKMKVTEVKVRAFALQKKLGFPETSKISGFVSPDDMKQALEVLKPNLDSAVEVHIKNKFPEIRKKDQKSSDEQIKTMIREEIYSHPGIMKLRLMIENSSPR